MKANLQSVLTSEPRLRTDDLARCYLDVRKTTESLAAPLSAEDQMIQAMPDASPTKWHQAHTTWFFETFILSEYVRGYQPFHPSFRFLFNSYYKQLGAHFFRPHRGFISRPSLDEVRAYRAHVDEHMLRLLRDAADDDLLAKVELGLNHEQQHQELIVTDIKYAFWMNPLRPQYWPASEQSKRVGAPLQWINFDGSVYSIGHNGDGFAFDNEGPRHEVFLRPFRLASRLVTNREYLDFMNDGGYRRSELWLSEGWDAVCANSWQAQLYWEQRDGEWWMFTCSGMRKVDLSEPVVHVSYFEADAYARWAGARLATEAEWEVAAARTPIEGNFLDNRGFHPQAATGNGLSHMFGDCWEWTASAYLSYPGFRAVAGALGEYNGKFMCNQFVLRGGSCATPRSHIRATYRNFFPPPARWQFSGIRLANDAD